MSKSQFLSRDEALTLIQLADKHWRGDRELPPEIVAKRKEIEDAIRNAELFMINLRIVDMGMVHLVVSLKRELDGLYCLWAQSESTARTLH